MLLHSSNKCSNNNSNNSNSSNPYLPKICSTPKLLYSKCNSNYLNLNQINNPSKNSIKVTNIIKGIKNNKMLYQIINKTMHNSCNSNIRVILRERREKAKEEIVSRTVIIINHNRIALILVIIPIRL